MHFTYSDSSVLILVQSLIEQKKFKYEVITTMKPTTYMGSYQNMAELKLYCFYLFTTIECCGDAVKYYKFIGALLELEAFVIYLSYCTVCHSSISYSTIKK